jgi:hypothetical protein
LKITSIVTAVVLAFGGVAAYSAYKASQRVPEFYREAISVAPQDQHPARDAFVAQATALAGDLHGEGRWQSLFTVEQINGWLALELAENYPDLMPGELHDPRISISDNEATIGCRYGSGELATVLSLTFDAYLQEPNVVALRIRHARAGALPVPLAQVLDSISHAARELNLQLEWRKSHGDPVALVTLPQPRDGQDANLRVETLELRQGELFIAGTTDGEQPDASPIVPEPLRIPTARQTTGDQPRVGSAEKETFQK